MPSKKSPEESSSLAQERSLAGHTARPPLGRSLVLWNTHGSSIRPPHRPRVADRETFVPLSAPLSPCQESWL